MKYMIIAAALIFAVSAEAQNTYSLEQCCRMALQNNIKMKTGRIDLQSAEQQQKDAKAAYLPTVSAGATYFHGLDYMVKEKISMSAEQQQQVAGIITQMGLDPTVLAALPADYKLEMLKHGTMVNLMAMEPVYAGGRITTGNKLAKLQTDVKKLMLEQSEDDIIQTTEKYYNQLLSLYSKKKTIEAAEEQLKSIRKDADNAYNAGVAYKNDVLTVELKQNELEANKLRLENGIRLSRRVLSQYIGMEEDINIDTTVITSLTADIPLPQTYAVDHDAALNNRVEAQLLDKSVEAQQLQTKLKRGELLPTLAVGATAFYHDMASSGTTNLVGLATLSIPISDWWSNSGVKRQKMEVRKAEEERENNRQLLKIQMQSAYDNLDNAYKMVQIAKKSITQSEENLRLNRDYYQAGTSAMSDLLDAQTKNQQAKDQMTDALIEYLNCKTAYLMATGRL